MFVLMTSRNLAMGMLPTDLGSSKSEIFGQAVYFPRHSAVSYFQEPNYIALIEFPMAWYSRGKAVNTSRLHFVTTVTPLL